MNFDETPKTLQILPSNDKWLKSHSRSSYQNVIFRETSVSITKWSCFLKLVMMASQLQCATEIEIQVGELWELRSDTRKYQSWGLWDVLKHNSFVSIILTFKINSIDTLDTHSIFFQETSLQKKPVNSGHFFIPLGNSRSEVLPYRNKCP